MSSSIVWSTDFADKYFVCNLVTRLLSELFVLCKFKTIFFVQCDFVVYDRSDRSNKVLLLLLCVVPVKRIKSKI